MVHSPQALIKFWSEKTFHSFTSLVGTAFIIYFIYRTAQFVWIFLRPSGLQRFRHAASGSWALVTGSSDGIGRAFAEELVRRGFRVLLHGRNEEKLVRVKNEILQTYPEGYIEFVVADASKPDDSYNLIVQKVKSLPGKLTILVNNVGGVTTYPQYVSHSEISDAHIDNIMNVNARFPTHITRNLLPLLKENAPSLILNTGSVGGLVGVPFIVTYSSTKGYIHSFSKALKNEMIAENVNVNVMCFVIGNTSSAGNTHHMPFTPSSRECAGSCLDKVGGDEALVWAHWKNVVPGLSAQLLPAALMSKWMGAEMKKRVENERKSD